MIIDGKQIAERIYSELTNTISHLLSAPHMTIITCAPTAATQTYLTYKTAAATRVGVLATIITLPPDSTTDDCMVAIARASIQTDGIVVQLPLPKHIDTDIVINAIPASLDIDGLRYPKAQTNFLPPVAGAVAEIARTHGVTFRNKQAVVVGYGRLVGQPCAAYLKASDATVEVITDTIVGEEARIKAADVLVLGTGQPGLITPDMIKDDVMVFDAGTAEVGDRLRGDADPSCAEKASLYTPVPGGIGPITIALLLKNCVQAQNQQPAAA